MKGVRGRNLLPSCFFVFVVWVCVGCVGVGCVVPCVGVDDYDTIVSQMQDKALEGVSKQDLDSLLSKLQPDGSFSDLKYGEDGSFAFRTHGRRQGALAYHHYNGEDVANEVVLAFTYITYDAPTNTDSNWWGHVIGTPSYMWEGVVIARNIISRNLMTDFLDRYWLNTQAGPVWDMGDHTGKMAGGNMGPRALLAEAEGLLRGEAFFPDRHAEVKEELHRELAERNPYNDDGLRPDGCLHQHTLQGDTDTQAGYLDHNLALIYNGNYGKEMIRFLANLFTWFTNTSQDYDIDTIEGLFSAYLECNQWLFRGHTFEPSSTGRFIVSGGTVTKSGTQQSIRDTGNHLLELGRHTAEVQAALHRYDQVVPDEEYALRGNKYFYNSDLTVHQRRNFMAAVRVLSNRTCRPETWSNTNENGYFQGDGFLTVLVDGGEYGEPNKEVFQVYDWARIPGVTNLYTTDIPQYETKSHLAEHAMNKARYVGGATDGMVGVTSMDYDRPYVSVTALKSYFFFEELVVVVGSRITLADSTGEDVITTLAQVMYGGEHVVGSTDGGETTHGSDSEVSEPSPAYLHHRDIGYVFLNADASLHVTAATRHLGSDPLQVFTAYVSHGSNPQDDALAYAVLPSVDLARTRDFYNNPDVEVVEASAYAHVVCHKPSMTVAASISSHRSISIPNCGQSGSIFVDVDTPSLIVVTVVEETPDEAQIRLTLSEPQQVWYNVYVKLEYEGRGVEGQIIVPQDPNRGSSVTHTYTL